MTSLSEEELLFDDYQHLRIYGSVDDPSMISSGMFVSTDDYEVIYTIL